MSLTKMITPCLWFDDQAEAAVDLYISVFKNSKITRVSRYGEAGYEIHQRPAGSVMAITFELDGQPFMALNGGPYFQLSEAISFQIFCETQDELDYFWEKLSEGGDPSAQQCGWLKDRFGLTWQVVPTILEELVGDPESEKSQRTTQAMLQMIKLDIAALQSAYEG